MLEEDESTIEVEVSTLLKGFTYFHGPSVAGRAIHGLRLRKLIAPITDTGHG